jgi:hypothetical protein
MMPTDVAHYGRATEPVMAPTVLSPRSILVHCTLARSENGAPVPAHVWLALQLNLRTPVLCVKPSNDPIDVIFFKALELPEKKLPERDATGRGWKLFIKTRVHGKADEFNSETIRLSPITSQTSDQQLDDVVAAIREFRAQALATTDATKAGHQGPFNKLDFQHLIASPDADSRDELPEYFTQSSAQTSALEVGSPFYVSPQAAGLYQPHYCAVPDDMYFYKCEDSAAKSCPAQGCGHGLASYVTALPSLSSQSDEERSESSSSETDGDEDSVAPVCRWSPGGGKSADPSVSLLLTLLVVRGGNGMCWKNGGFAGGISKRKSIIVGSWARWLRTLPILNVTFLVRRLRTSRYPDFTALTARPARTTPSTQMN